MASTRKRLEALTAGLMLPAPASASTAERSSPETSNLLSPATTPVETRFPPVDAAFTPVETRFPRAGGGAPTPRTGPGQMMAFRGQIQQVEGEMAALRERLAQYEGSLPTRQMDPKTIRPSRWANRHDASFGTSAFAGLKADIEHAGGNVQPILVRPLKGEAGQFEIVFGHRRHRASLELGTPVLASIWLEEMGDAALFAAMDRENRERADLSNYEQGQMYQRALEEQLFPTQRQLAEALGVSHTWVRKALLVAQLPNAVVECFRSPLEISFRHAEQIHAAMEKDRKGVLKRVEKIRSHSLAPAIVVARLLDEKPGFERAEKLDVQIEGHKVGDLARAKTGVVTITLLPNALSGIDLQALEAAIGQALRKIQTLG